MKNASKDAGPAIAADNAAARRHSAAERQRRHDNREMARERAEVERERAEIRRKLPAAELLSGCQAMLKLRRRHEPPQPRLICERSLSLVGSPSFLLLPRVQDDGAMWPALANRCRRALPEDLEWAAPLLDPGHPLPVLCGKPDVVALFCWLDALPNTARVSIGCQRKAPKAGARAH